jgi:hypothetical protein
LLYLLFSRFFHQDPIAPGEAKLSMTFTDFISTTTRWKCSRIHWLLQRSKNLSQTLLPHQCGSHGVIYIVELCIIPSCGNSSI